MNPVFAEYVGRVPDLMAELRGQPIVPIVGTTFPKAAAIYVFFLEAEPLHVGRTRNLRQRLQGHRTNSHFSASFAFNRARASTGRVATYRKGEGRETLLADAVFADAFAKALAEVRGMGVQYLVVDDPIEQYLLELHAALELGTSLSEFDTH